LILIEARATASQTGDIQQKEAPLLAHQFVDDPGAYFNADEPLIQSRSRREKKFVKSSKEIRSKKPRVLGVEYF
jgi:hypothetical protein